MKVIDAFEAAAETNKYVNCLLWVVLAVGTLKATKLFLSFISMMLELFVLPAVTYKKYGIGKGAYALITGASDGIGKEYAIQLAQRGFNLVLVSRTQSKLEALKADILAKYGEKIDIRLLAIDFSKDEQSGYDSVRMLCEGIPITVLVNNVGQSHSIPVAFSETEEKELRDIITINNIATLLLTQAVLPSLKKSVKQLKCKGLILTMGSFGGLLPTPYLATYSGSKAFLQNWSNALGSELAADNIHVEFVLSYLVTSAMSKIRRTSALIPNPKLFVRATLSNVGRRVGSQERYATITPYWSHALYHFAIENSFGVYSKLVNKINMHFHQDIRKRALRKAARIAAAKED